MAGDYTVCLIILRKETMLHLIQSFESAYCNVEQVASVLIAIILRFLKHLHPSIAAAFLFPTFRNKYKPDVITRLNVSISNLAIERFHDSAL